LRLCSSGSVSGSVYYTGSDDEDDEATNIYLHDDAVVITGVSNVTNREYKTILYDMDFGTLDVCSFDVMFSFFIPGGTDWQSEGNTPYLSISASNILDGDTVPRSVNIVAQFGSNVCEANTQNYDYAHANDITPITLTANFSAGNSTWVQNVNYSVVSDALTENNEYFTWHLESPVGGYIDNNASCSRTIIYSNWAGISEIEKNNMRVNVFPNPSKDIITIKPLNNEKISSVEIIDNLGSVIYSEKYINPKINIENLNSGFYILRIELIDGTPVNKRIVKN
jgi:hypothetical protein